MHYMKWIYPRRLRNQMILMAILMVIVPTLTIGYIVETEGRSAVLSEKEKKLSAWICPYISRHLLSLTPLQARCRRYSRGER